MYGCSVSEDYLSWTAIIGLLIIMSFFIISLVYMLSQFFKRPDWAVWAKSELWQTIAACIIVGLILSFTGTACMISESLAGGDPFYISDRYLHYTLWNRLVPAVNNLFQLSFKAQKLSVFTLGLISCSEGICFQPFAGLGTLSYSLETMASIITPFGASLLFQKLFLQFVKDIAFTIILPIGFILKVFPFTREAGAFLIAAAVAFYVVFPLTYVFNSTIMREVMYDPMVANWCQKGLVGWGGGLSGLGSGACQALNTVGQVLPQAAFLPALNLVITISFMQTLSKILARDYQEDLQ